MMAYGERARAIVIGYQGQDGALLCKQLRDDGVEVIGIGRTSIFHSESNSSYNQLIDITDANAICSLLTAFQPDEIYYLAAYHHSSQDSLTIPALEVYQRCYAIHVLGLINCLEAIRLVCPQCRLFYASSSLIFSGEHGKIQNEHTPYSPSGFYAVTKVHGMSICNEYRTQYNIFASTGILFNHESALRAPKFLSQKIIRAAINIKQGSTEKLVLGDLSAEVDWGYAPDYVQAFQSVLKTEKSDDFIIASGEAHSVKEFVESVFSYFSLSWQDFVVEDAGILSRRPLVKIGDASKLKHETAWTYNRKFDAMIERLILDTQLHLGIS